MDINRFLPRSHDAKCLHIPYEQRWEHLKPIIVELYMGKYGPNGKSMTTHQVLVFMRDHYSFHAAETQYRTWFNKWGVRRRTLATEKEDIASALGKRTHPGTSTSDVTLNPDKPVNKKQLTRYLKDQIHHHQPELMRPGV
ncbi:hypothetical protein C8A05DRAFT_46405 [Staphylotrichum tortipilum]|uniref:Clr5 domain-containing protein n=1 Tax=Staphylotrichum tortipilum TaxID=2831512 RepID=A0AAN6MFH8_9PEZI|nr:hypothetical protein C8A05DRAFT_46405 [Staphylotrichum longicolle]